MICTTYFLTFFSELIPPTGYKSIMLYPSYNSFAIDYSKPTMTKKDGSTFNAQRNNLSYIDIVAIYDIYGFPTGGGGPSVTSIK